MVTGGFTEELVFAVTVTVTTDGGSVVGFPVMVRSLVSIEYLIGGDALQRGAVFGPDTRDQTV